MAESKNTVKAEAIPEDKYSVSEFVLNAEKLFNTDDIIVKSALDIAGKKEYTLSEAKKLVNDFMNKEV